MRASAVLKAEGQCLWRSHCFMVCTFVSLSRVIWQSLEMHNVVSKFIDFFSSGTVVYICKVFLRLTFLAVWETVMKTWMFFFFVILYVLVNISALVIFKHARLFVCFFSHFWWILNFLEGDVLLVSSGPCGLVGSLLDYCLECLTSCCFKGKKKRPMCAADVQQLACVQEWTDFKLVLGKKQKSESGSPDSRWIAEQMAIVHVRRAFSLHEWCTPNKWRCPTLHTQVL